MTQQPQSFEDAKARLEEIADAVSNDEMPLDEALDLFEEAVLLGLAVSDLVEEGIVVEEADEGELAGTQVPQAQKDSAEQGIPAESAHQDAAEPLASE